MEKIRILQLGKEDWNKIYELPPGIHLDCVGQFTKLPEKPYDLFFLDRIPREEEIDPLYQAVKAYTLFITEKAFSDNDSFEKGSDRVAWLCQCKKAKQIATKDIQQFLQREARYYYPKSYGEKFNPKNLAIAQGFSGEVKWNGNYSVTLEGEFGASFRQVAFWRNNIPLPQLLSLDFWLEYSKSSGVKITLTIVKFASGSISHVLKRWEFGEEALKKVIRIDGDTLDGWLFISLSAMGKGKLQIIALHERFSRGKHGYFMPGGKRYVASNKEEAFCYFEPGDLRPPLNVYFSGYKTAQGFEGYHMMRDMGCPFLLLTESRLEGGGFYMGTPEYERLFVGMIRKYMKELGFSADQVILSGLSMGTFGALYYGCDILPHAIILGKPLANIGDVAANEKYLRSGGFPTSLDVLRYQCGGLDADTVQGLNDKFWKKFDAVNWGHSKFAISYMIEDDYDADAYYTLLSHLRSTGVQVYGKGIHGRHNDNTGAIVNWFVTQYKRILQEDFGRKIKGR